MGAPDMVSGVSYWTVGTDVACPHLPQEQAHPAAGIWRQGHKRLGRCSYYLSFKNKNEIELCNTFERLVTKR